MYLLPAGPITICVPLAACRTYHNVPAACRLITIYLLLAGPITMYNPYQSSDYNILTHPAVAAIDGNIYTSSQTAVDTAGCSHINEEGLYGTCGLMVGCMSAPAYTQAYASTPNYPFWTAEFSSDASVSPSAQAMHTCLWLYVLH